MTHSPNVHIIVLNWNGWKDTIECLESLLHLDYRNYTLVVCDNASSDDSLRRIEEWAEGKILVEGSNPRLSHFVCPQHSKPVKYRSIKWHQREPQQHKASDRLVIIENGANLGFAGGNNVGLRFALNNPDCQYCWILNNDTVVEPGALSAMVRMMHATPNLGLCGSLTLYYSSPTEVQAPGGMSYNFWTGRVATPSRSSLKPMDSGIGKVKYVNGASMLASRGFLEHIGLMEESYFLYFEEIDWAMRAKNKFKLGYAPDSVIYHKEGATIGTSPDRSKRTLISEQYLSRNRVLFTKRFFPWALPTVVLSVCLAAAERLGRRDYQRAKLIMISMLDGLLHQYPRSANTELQRWSI